MTRLTGLAAVASIALTSAFAFAAVEFRRMGSAFTSLEDRVVLVENATGGSAGTSPAPLADGGFAAPGRTPATVAGVHEEVVKLREEVARLRREETAEVGGPLSAQSNESAARAPATAELAKAVTDALAAKEKVDKEKQAKLYRKQMDLSAKAWAGQLAGKLELTEQQKSQISEIFAEYWTKMSSGWTGAAVDEDAELPDYQKLNEEMNEKVKAVMTTEQAAKYDELVKKNQVWGGVVVDGGDSDDGKE